MHRKTGATQFLSFNNEYPEKRHALNKSENFTNINEHLSQIPLQKKESVVCSQNILSKKNVEKTVTVDKTSTPQTFSHAFPTQEKSMSSANSLKSCVQVCSPQDIQLENKSSVVKLVSIPTEIHLHSNGNVVKHISTSNATDKLPSTMEKDSCVENCDYIGQGAIHFPPTHSSVSKHKHTIPFSVVMDDTIEELKEDLRKSNRKRKRRKRFYLDSDEDGEGWSQL